MTLVHLARESAIHVRIREGWTLGATDDGVSFIASSPHGAVGTSLGPYVPEFEPANARLLDGGAPLGTLRDAVIDSGGTQLAAFYLVWLQRLCSWGLIEFPLVDETGERAIVLPQWHSFVPALAEEVPHPQVRLDRFACIRRDRDIWLLESPLVGARFSVSELASINAPLVRRALHCAGFLEDASPAPGPKQLALEQWEFHDLMFHAHHRVGWHRDPAGAVFPYIGEIEPPPAVRPSWPGERIVLPHASRELAVESFAEVLERRRSERIYDEDHPISLGELGALLDRASRIRGFEILPVSNLQGRTGTFEITRRPYPSGGASYELEIYPVVSRCDGLEPGLYHYDSADHELIRISGETAATARLLAEATVATAGQAHPQIVLAVAARFSRVMWKYKSIAYGVILRNVGALYQTLYLAATELGLSPCGIGSGDSEVFAKATGLDPVIEGTVGEFILGGRPRRS